MYSLFFKNNAEKFLKKLNEEDCKRILKKLEQLKQNPNLGFPLVGNFAGLRKLRIGDYRVIYKIISNKLIIVIVDMSSRKNIYKK
tara:strand:- start:800 stop:1054 length:255 start_codon:yes stop_codon:yes gene_type:complete